MGALFEDVQNFIRKPFDMNGDGEFDLLEWAALTAATVTVAFFVWHALRGLYE